MQVIEYVIDTFSTYLLQFGKTIDYLMRHIKNLFLSLLLNTTIYLVVKYIFHSNEISSVHFAVMTTMVFFFATIIPFPKKLKNDDKKTYNNTR